MASDVKEDAFQCRQVAIKKDRNVRDLYTLKEQLGKGKFGIVYRCIENETGKVWAAKFIKCKGTEKEAVKKEILIMNDLQHPKLLQCADAFESTTDVVMILEFVSGGELFDRVIDDDFELTEKEVIIFMRQICEGVQYMHEQGILHLDLKPENILCISKNSNQIKLIDFGLARKFNPKENLKEMVGTPEFVAPEVINFESLNFATDMWSVGVICYVLLSGLSPFMGDNDAETLTNVTRAEWDFDDESFDEITDDAKDFIEMLLIKQKSERNTVEQCIRHTWLRQDTKTMKANKLSTSKLKKWLARRRWQKTANAVKAIGRMASLTMFSRLNKSGDKSATPFSAMLKAKREEEAKKQEEEIDIDLKDPEVAKAASKIQGVFRKTRQPKTEVKMDSKHEVGKTAPKFTQELKDIEVCEGSAARFDCVVVGAPEPDIRWLKDGKEIQESKHHRMDFGDDDSVSLIIAEVKEDDDGEYICEATNIAGKATSAAEIIVEVMGSSEEDESSEEEQSKAGIPFKKPSIAPTREPAPAKPEVKSVRDKAPEFVLRPRNTTGGETKSTRFACTFEGKPTASVTWKFEDRILSDSGRFEIYDEEGVYYLEIFELKVTDSGMYTCTLSNTAGKVTAKAALAVMELDDGKKKLIKEPIKKTTTVPVKKEPPKLEPAKPKDKKPEFLTRPKSQTVTTPKGAMFTCKISGTPKPTVRWDKDGKILKDEGRFEIYEEGDEQILEIFDTQVSDSGMYTVTALNTLGRVTGMAKLTVDGKKEISQTPKFIKRMKDCKILDAEEAIFECHVTGTPKPKVIWQLDGKDIKDGDIYEISFDGKVAKLVIAEAFLDEDDGEYTCKVINTAGQVSCTAELIIEEVKKTPIIKGLKPEFVDKISDMTVVDGHEVKLTVRVKGSPTPNILWLYNNKPLEDCEDFQYISKGDIHMLTFPEIFTEDAGKYTCRASNTAGQSECSAMLTVKGTPTMTQSDCTMKCDYFSNYLLQPNFYHFILSRT